MENNNLDNWNNYLKWFEFVNVKNMVVLINED